MDASEEMRREYKQRAISLYWKYFEFKRLFLLAQDKKRKTRSERDEIAVALRKMISLAMALDEEDPYYGEQHSAPQKIARACEVLAKTQELPPDFMEYLMDTKAEA